MLDVLHFLFEEDFTSHTEEHARSKSAMRTSLYKDMYGVNYAFKMKDRQNGRSAGGNITDVQHVDDFETYDKVEPFNPRKGQDSFSPRNGPEDSPQESKVKFVDASKVRTEEHFSSALDAPLG